MDAPFPMHPSYEARGGVPDRSFPLVSPGAGRAHGRGLDAADRRLARPARARVLHLHHLTPIHGAAAAVRRTSRSSRTCTAPS